MDLLEALSRAGLYLGSAIATASATTIALMLTLIGLIKRMNEDFDEQAYRNVELVARLSTVTLLIALLGAVSLIATRLCLAQLSLTDGELRP